MELISLASSSAGCCYQLKSGTLPPLLIDAGLGFDQIQKAIAFGASKLAGVLISHAHGDHVKGVRGLLDNGINCYSSRETWDLMKISHHRANCIEPQTTFLLDGWKIKGFPAIHDAPGTLGFLIDDDQGERLLYLTDSAYSPFKFEGLTMIAVEANYSPEILKQRSRDGEIDRSRYGRLVNNHMSIDTLIELLKANDLSKVEMIYLLHLSDANSDEADFKERVQRATGKVVIICAKQAVLN